MDSIDSGFAECISFLIPNSVDSACFENGSTGSHSVESDSFDTDSDSLDSDSSGCVEADSFDTHSLRSDTFDSDSTDFWLH